LSIPSKSLHAHVHVQVSSRCASSF
jgi:hypothetical protein